MKPLTKALLALVAAFALVAVIIRFWPPPPPVKISILTTDTKAEWLGAVTKDFNNAHQTITNGRSIQVEMLQVSGPEVMKQKLLDGSNVKPVLGSPGDISWIDQANEILKQMGKSEIGKDDCPPIVYVPTGFTMWRPMAEALGWPDEPISWKQISDLAADPQGWNKYGKPDWGQFKFGHTHPEQSTTGFNILASLAYAAAGKTEGLTPQDVKSDAVKNAFRKLEKDTYHYGLSNRGLLDFMIQRGFGYLHAAASSETSFIRSYQNYSNVLPFPWAFVFPAEGVFWSDNPTCILQASWVTPEKQEAARIYRDYLLAPRQQEQAIDWGLRPALHGIGLHCPICAAYGTDPRVTPQSVPPLASVSGETNAAIIDLFKQTKKKATVAVLLDTSSSMEGEKLKNAVAGSIEFLKRLDKDDEIEVYTFGKAVTKLKFAGRVGDVEDDLTKTLQGLGVEGSTTEYDAVCTAVQKMDQARAEDLAAGEKRLYGVVLLSDGEDTNSEITQNGMFDCLPTGVNVEGTRVYTIAYGDDANKDLLTRIANRTNGKTYTADPKNIEQIYLQISAEQ
jgi:Ca-activated chloride channel homolog